MTRRRWNFGRRWVSVLAAVLLVMAPAVVSVGVSALPARATDCDAGVDCPGDIGGGGEGFDNGLCVWDSCGDGLQAGDPDAQDFCDGTSCTDGQNPPDKQCPITVNPDGSITCTVTDTSSDNPAPTDCFADGSCEDPLTEVPLDPGSCAPQDDPGVSFDQDYFQNISLGTDPFPVLDPLYDPNCETAAPPPAPATQFGATDVAFGDSFISGEGTGMGEDTFYPGPGPLSCDVSHSAWPDVIYGPISAAAFASNSSDPFENWSCTGATTAVVSNQISSAITAGDTDDNVTHNQWAGLGQDTLRVQISAGGDDLGFGDAITCAFKLFPERDDQHATQNGQPCIPSPSQLDQLIANDNLLNKLIGLYQLVLLAVPGVTVEAVGYPMIFPQGSTPACGWKQTHISRADQMYINNDTARLDQYIRVAAADAGARYIDLTTALQGATICDNPRGVNTIGDVGGIFGHTRGAFHPNVFGHDLMATAYTRNSFFIPAGASAAVPADGTVVGDRFGDHVYLAAGGALWPFPNQPDLATSFYKGNNITLEPSNQIAAQLQAKPADGTLLVDEATGGIFETWSKNPLGEALIPKSPDDLLVQGGWKVPDSALAGYPLAEGYFFTVAGGDGTVYEVIGGAPVVVTNWSHAGGPQEIGVVSRAQFDAMPQYPRDGAFAQTSTGLVYEFIGGAPVVVTDWSHVGGVPDYSGTFTGTLPVIDNTAVINAGSGGAFNHLRQYPADGTLAVATVPTGSVDDPGTFYYVFAGGAPILISDWSQLGGQPSGPMTPIDYISIDNAGTGGAWNHLRQQPADDTVLQSGSASAVYQVEGGTPESGCNPAASPVVIDQTALDKAGTGGAFNHLNPPASGCTASGLDDHASAFKIFYGSPGTGNASVTDVASPAEDGGALDVSYQAGNQAYQDITTYTKLGTDDSATAYNMNLDFYLPATAPVQAVDFSMSNYVQNVRYQWALQWEGIGTGAPQWRIWTGTGWQAIGVSAALQPGTWYHLSLDGDNTGGKVRYDDFTIGGQTHSLAAYAFAPTSEAGDGLVASVTLSGDSAADPYHVYLDNAHFTSVEGGNESVQTVFQANTGNLWAVGDSNSGDQGIAMMAGTSPSATLLTDGSLKIAYQGTNGDLWVTRPGSTPTDTGLGMMAGTSPAITALPYNGWMAAFQANTGNLWVTGPAGTGDQQLGMLAGTSPAITTLPSGSAEIAFQANTGHLWTNIPGSDAQAQERTAQDQQLGMLPGTSPAIATLSSGSAEIAFQANTGHLWTDIPGVSAGDQGYGMLSGTSPVIAALPGGGAEVAFQASTGHLWLAGQAGTGDQGLGMMKGTSPVIAANF